MIGCLFGLIAFFLPRVAIIFLLLFSNWILDAFKALSSPFSGLLLPILGLLFMPYTLLAYCLAWHQSSGSVGGMWLILIGVAVLFDFGVIGHGSRARKKRKS
jgi:hypothetical protein